MIEFTRKAEIAFKALLPEDREYVNDAVQSLERPAVSHADQKIKKLGGDDNLFIMSVTPKLRIIFQVSDGVRQIMDIFQPERLEKMYKNERIYSS